MNLTNILSAKIIIGHLKNVPWKHHKYYITNLYEINK